MLTSNLPFSQIGVDIQGSEDHGRSHCPAGQSQSCGSKAILSVIIDENAVTSLPSERTAASART
ncbi:MAG: hypothetical protein KKD05_06240 [Candidatus Omnitrophica bacterium]|nr:hypothetical protein [Candidatus Omnitrophota bacterium]